MKRVVLAYSGGLDTSVAVRWLKQDRGFDEVYAIAVDIGQVEDWDQVRARGEIAGAAEVRVVDAKDRFANEFLSRAIKANALYEGKYPLVAGLSRPLIADEIVAVAREVGADAVAHGCTGKGNDQVRFELTFSVQAPDLQIIAPMREAQISREQALAWADEWGIPVSPVAGSYSIDENMWGRCCECGPIEDPWNPPPEDAFARTAPPEKRPSEPAEIMLAFERGVPVSLDGEQLSLAEIVRRVDDVAGAYGYGRIDMIENRRVGIKSREVYEVPGGLSLIVAHQALEDLNLEREVSHFKPIIETRFSELVYDGQWFSPLMQALNGFIDSTQENVTGEVRLQYNPGTMMVVGRRSDLALYDEGLATYGAEDSFDHAHAEGFVRLWGLSLKTWSAKQKPRP
ncbi:MAG: argininosuccinate synthase [Actinomycetota bacterium]